MHHLQHLFLFFNACTAATVCAFLFKRIFRVKETGLHGIFFTFTTFVIQWKIDFRSTCCFRLKKTFFFLFGKKTERGKWKQHKVANRKLQMLHCIMQMLRLITAQKLKTFSYFPNATTSHTYTNSTYQNLIKTLSKTYFFSCDLSDSASKVVQRIVKSNKNSNVFNFLRRQFQ